MAHALYLSVNASVQDENSAVNLNDSLVSHVIVRSGFVYYKAGLLKGFHKYWCRFYRENDIYPRQLVLNEIVKNKKEVSQFIPLDNVFKVSIDNEKHQFDIMTSTKKYSIRTATLQEATIWVETINQEVFGLPLPGIIYRFMVKTDRCHKGKGPIADYLLKVFDDRIQLYSSNGKIPTDFSCKLRDIHRIKCLTAKGHKEMIEYVSITIKNAQSNFIEKDILVLQVKSSGDLYKVINHRKQLILLSQKSSQTSTPKRPSVTPQEILSNRSSGCAAEEEIHDVPSIRQTYDTGHRELSKCLMKSFSISDGLDQPLPQSAAYSSKSRTSPRPKLYPSLSRSSQDISDSGQFSSKNHKTLPSQSSNPADHQNKFLQVPIAMTKISQSDSGGPKSASVPEIQTEEIYENVDDASQYYTAPLVNHSSIDDNDDDEYYVVNYIDRYLKILPPSNCDKHLNITTTDVDDDNIDKNLYENITTADVDDNDNIYDDVKNII